MSVEVSPPPYHATGHFSNPKANLNPIGKAHPELIAYLKTKAPEAVRNDLLKLSDTIVSIENDFATVTSEMTRLDEKLILSVKFAPKWEVLHEQYTRLILESQVTANNVSGKIDDLVNVQIPILQDPNQTMDCKKEVLTEYIEELKSFKNDAEESSVRFLRLSQAVNGFKKDLKHTVESEKKEVDKSFEDIEKRILELEKALGKSSNWLQRVKKVVITALQGGKVEDAQSTETTPANSDHEDIAAINALADIAPTVPQEMMAIILPYLKTDLAEELKQKPKDMDVASMEQQLAQFQFKLEQKGLVHAEFSTVLQDLLKLEPIFTGMIQRISTIQQIWLLLLGDSQKLLNKLSSLKDAKLKVLFDRHVMTLEAIYATLQFSLRQYALTVAKPT